MSGESSWILKDEFFNMMFSFQEVKIAYLKKSELIDLM